MSYDLYDQEEQLPYDPYAPEEQLPIPSSSKDLLTHQRPIALNSRIRSSPPIPLPDYNLKTPYDVEGGGVNVPLLPLRAPQTVQLPRTQNVGTGGPLRINIRHSNWSASERGKDDKQLSLDYPWTAVTTNDKEYYSPNLHPSSAEAQYATEMQSHSPNYSKSFDTTPPSTSSTLGTFPTQKPPERHPFAKNFEVPQWRNLAIHIGLCGLTYPFMLIFVFLGQSKALFFSRLFVGAGSGILGVMFSLSLMRLARGILEAATWATVIHQSRVPDAVAHEAGVRLKDLAAHSDTSLWAALRLLWDRCSYPGADRKYRKSYDARTWSIWIVFFLLNLIFSGTLSFLFGRAVKINIQVAHQHSDYQEVAVIGDLSNGDLNQANAIQDPFKNFALTWTMAPFSSHGELPNVISLDFNNDSVFFSEVVLSQLIPGGSGFGTFNLSAMAPSLDISSQDVIAAAPTLGVQTGSILRFPRWGIRIKCAKIPEISLNLVTKTNNGITYLFNPQSTIHSLFDDFNLSFPQILEQPLNPSTVLLLNDTLPSSLDISKISLGAAFWDNGVTHSLKSYPLGPGQDGNGFMTVENILVRLNNTYAPNGTFGVKGNLVPGFNGAEPTFIGYDAAVCLELYEPWVLEVYNSSVGFPNTMRIVDKGATIVDMNTEKVKENRLGKSISDPLVKRELNSTNMTVAYDVAHQNSVNQILKDNSRDSNYVPSPTLISFTGGSGPNGYTVLSEVDYAKSRALADAGNVLPYFSGSGLVVARSYQDQVVTSPVIVNITMSMTILAIFLMGLIPALFIPRLPLDVPRRGFDLYSWLSAFYAHELVAERPAGISKDMDLRDIKDYTSEMKFRYWG